MKNKSNWPILRKVNIIADPPGWFQPHANELASRIIAAGHQACVISDQSKVESGDIAFYLSCSRITPKHLLDRNSWNIVVHASALPEGRGFSPLVWQILEGKKIIPLTMITMTEEVDAGEIIDQKKISFEGHELNDEMRETMGHAIVEMCYAVAVSRIEPSLRPQNGEPSWYLRRGPKDSQLDPDQTISSQFDLLRVVDNENYPAYFDFRGHRYFLTITREPLKEIDRNEF